MNDNTDMTGAFLVTIAMLAWTLRQWRYCRVAREQLRIAEQKLADAHERFIATAEIGHAINSITVPILGRKEN